MVRPLTLFALVLLLSFAGRFPNGTPAVHLYLTFDDGPSAGTAELYRLADSNGIKINVFIVGHRVFGDSDCYRLFRHSLDDTLILAGNHSYTHAGGRYRHYYEDPAGVPADFDRNRDMLRLKNSIARMPGRNCWRVGHRRADDIVNGKEAADSLAAHGYEVFGWDIEWKCGSVGGKSRYNTFA